MPPERRRPLGGWTTRDFADALGRLKHNVDSATIERWRSGRNQTNRRDRMLAILAVFFPAPDEHGVPHPDRQRMLEAWTMAQRRAHRPQPDAAEMQRAGAALLAIPREPDAIDFVPERDQLVVARGAASDREAAALPLVVQLHPLIVEKLSDLIEAAGARLDNQRAWRGLSKAARRLHAAMANAGPGAAPDQLAILYDQTVSLGSFVDLDDRLGTTRNPLDEPLEPDIRRALADVLGSLAPWLRQFPTVLGWDSARRDFLTRPELFEPVRARLDDARQVVEQAASAGVLSAEDAAELAVPLETAERPGLQGEKAGYRAVSTARHLAVTALGWKLSLGAALLTGAVASDYATKSALVGRLGTFLAGAEAQVIRLVEGSPYDLVAAVRYGLSLARDDAPEDAPPNTAAPLARREEKDEPPPDFDLDRVRKMTLAGRAPPTAWVPWIKELDFDRTKLADLAPLAGLANLQSLLLDGTQVADLAPLAGLANLQILSLYGTQVADLAPLAGLAKLQTLWLNGTQVADLAPLAGLANLQVLVLDGTHVTDLAPLAGLANLQTLSLDRTLVADLAPLAGLANLQTLSLDRTLVADLAPLAGLANLRQLALDVTPVADFAPLAGLAKLDTLTLNGTHVADLAPLAGLAKLESLHLADTQVADLAPLAGLANLETLHLADTQVADVAPLTGLASLRTLHLARTEVADLAPLAGLANLQLLDLEGTPVADLRPLAGLADMQRLLLGSTQVADLAPLAGLANLQTLILGGTPVADLAPLAGLANLHSLDLEITQVTDLVPLAGLAELRELWLSGTLVADLAPVAGLEKLLVHIGGVSIRPADHRRHGLSLQVAVILQIAAQNIAGRRDTEE